MKKRRVWRKACNHLIIPSLHCGFLRYLGYY